MDVKRMVAFLSDIADGWEQALMVDADALMPGVIAGSVQARRLESEAEELNWLRDEIAALKEQLPMEEEMVK